MAELRTRDRAGKNEQADITKIVNAIRTKSAAGLQIISAFKEKFGVDILDVRQRAGGNRATHNDFQICVAPNEWKNVEHKGSQKCVPILPDQTPWAAGVQFHNGGCDKYSIGKLYARVWYDTHVASGILKAEWNLVAPIPSFDDWFKQDAKKQGNPGTLFGKELKEKVRGAKTNLGEKRAAAHLAFQPTEADLQTFKQEVLTILNDALEKKDYWLTIHGNLDETFYCAWYPKFTIRTIDSVTIRKELDIWFDFNCPECKFSCILRWGKGAGFSNLRIDARD